MLTNALIRPSTEALGTTPEPRESGEMAGSGFVFPIGLLFDFNLVEISTFIPSTQPSDLHCAPPSPLPPVKPSLGTSKPSFYLRASSAAVCPLPSRQCTCRRPHAAVLGHIFFFGQRLGLSPSGEVLPRHSAQVLRRRLPLYHLPIFVAGAGSHYPLAQPSAAGVDPPPVGTYLVRGFKVIPGDPERPQAEAISEEKNTSTESTAKCPLPLFARHSGKWLAAPVPTAGPPAIRSAGGRR